VQGSAAAAEATLKPFFPAAFSTGSMKGKKFAAIAITTSPTLVDTIQSFQEALQSVGATVLPLNGQSNPDVIAQAFSEAIAQHVAGIVTMGLTRRLWLPRWPGPGGRDTGAGR
jgi:DNA-binding LacI/PurR family transcriptional regulator